MMANRQSSRAHRARSVAAPWLCRARMRRRSRPRRYSGSACQSPRASSVNRPYSRSMIVALSMPPASHMVCRPSATASLERMQHGRHQARARCSQRMADRDRATAGIESRRVDREFALPSQRPAGKRFVDFEMVDRAGRKRSEEHTSELQSLMRISYAVFCLKKKKKIPKNKNQLVQTLIKATVATSNAVYKTHDA